MWQLPEATGPVIRRDRSLRFGGVLPAAPAAQQQQGKDRGNGTDGDLQVRGLPPLFGGGARDRWRSRVDGGFGLRGGLSGGGCEIRLCGLGLGGFRL
ncbi:hypothetical protein MMAS_00570 [Mycobacteroides abscessus subsp. massiliense CCUG 48898 = JCM 15300]|nr:hypothetical protein MMAS_00570 [Mycobacteroides abscessus subsp. massiliense CCUG 48898 = JCM 15300]